MSKRHTGVRLIEDNTYEINFRPYKKAKRIFKRIKADSVQEAANKRAEVISRFLEANNVTAIDKERQGINLKFIKGVLENDLKSDNKTKKTLNRFLLSWKTFMKFLNEKYPHIDSVNRLNSSVFSDYKDYIVLECGRQYGWRGELSIIKAIFKRLQRRGYCDKEILNQLANFKRPPRREMHYEDISRSDVKKLLSYIDKNRPDLTGIVYFIYRLGWRIEETCHIRRADVKWSGLKPKELLIRAETTKTKISRKLDVFDEDLSKMIRRYAMDRRKSVWLFPNRNNNKHTGGRVRDYLKTASKMVLGRSITPHYFRHRFCTMMGQNNVPIADVMVISGIKDVEVLLHYYQHSTKKGKEKVLEQSRSV